MTKIEMKPQYWAIALLVAWLASILALGLLRSDDYGLSEGGALNLLLGWSASAQVGSPITFIGNLDFRLLPDYLIGLYWPGSITAARVFSLLLYFFAIIGLYRWSRQQSNEESAKIASGLMLIFPGGLVACNSLDVGPFILILFVGADILHRRYQQSPHAISAWYFIQLITAAACLSLHPMGAVYPLLLAWHWFSVRKEQAEKTKVMLIGLFAACLFVAAMNIGWIDARMGASPPQVWDDALTGFNELDSEHGWLMGWFATILLLLTLYWDRKALLSQDLLTRLLALAVVVGAVCADLNWALIATAYLFYRGSVALLSLNRRLGKQSFITQRGISFSVILLMCFVFTQSDRALVLANKSEVLNAQDELIKTLANSIDATAPFFAASQWPARTMMACKRDVFRLPPTQMDGEQLLKSIRVFTHIIFDPNQARNHQLSKNLSQINDKIKTVAIQEGGVIIAIRNPDVSHLPKIEEKKIAPETNPTSDLPSQK